MATRSTDTFDYRQGSIRNVGYPYTTTGLAASAMETSHIETYRLDGSGSCHIQPVCCRYVNSANNNIVDYNVGAPRGNLVSDVNYSSYHYPGDNQLQQQMRNGDYYSRETLADMEWHNNLPRYVVPSREYMSRMYQNTYTRRVFDEQRRQYERQEKEQQHREDRQDINVNVTSDSSYHQHQQQTNAAVNLNGVTKHTTAASSEQQATTADNKQQQQITLVNKDELVLTERQILELEPSIGYHRFTYALSRLPAFVCIMIGAWYISGRGRQQITWEEKTMAVIAFVTGLYLVLSWCCAIVDHDYKISQARWTTIIRCVLLVFAIVLGIALIVFSIWVLVRVHKDYDVIVTTTTPAPTMSDNERIGSSAALIAMGFFIVLLSVVSLCYGLYAIYRLDRMQQHRVRPAAEQVLVEVEKENGNKRY